MNMGTKTKRRLAHEVIGREPKVEWNDVFEEGYLLRGKCNPKCFDIGVQVLYLPSADDRKNIGGFLQNIRDCHCDGASGIGI